jgi:diacylglycerol O-acyltransferase / wax synthase
VLSILPDAALLPLAQRATSADVQASNVPGYAQETFLAGAKVERQYGMGPLPGVAMMVVLVSRAGMCTVSCRYDAASFAVPDQLEKCLQLGFDEVVELGRPRPRATGAPRSRATGAPRSRATGVPRRTSGGGRSR